MGCIELSLQSISADTLSERIDRTFQKFPSGEFLPLTWAGDSLKQSCIRDRTSIGFGGIDRQAGRKVCFSHWHELALGCQCPAASSDSLAGQQRALKSVELQKPMTAHLRQFF